MAYKRKAMVKRPRRRVIRRRGDKKVMSNAVITKMLRRLPPPEVKTSRFLYTNTGANALPDYNGLNWGLDFGVWLLNPTQNRIDITQGVGQGQRVGNNIRTKSSYLSGILYANQQNAAYNTTPKPYEVMFIIYKILGQGNIADVTLTGLFQNGNSQAIPTGTLQDLTLPINQDKYRIYYRRVFKIGPADNTGSGSSTGLQFFANNDYKRNQRFYIPLTKYMDKRMKFNDTDRNVKNDNLYLAVLPLACDGTQQVAGNSLAAVNMLMTQTYNYTDV